MAKIIRDALDEQDIKEIYEKVQASSNSFIHPRYGQEVIDFQMPEHINHKIVAHTEKVFNVTGLELVAYQFARYKNMVDQDGNNLVPNLFPHFDPFDEKKYTFDLQLDTNTSWDIFVEEEKFSLDNNNALVFSGTHEIHWRAPKVFEEDEFLEMLFCHLNIKNGGKLPANHKEDMTLKEKIYADKFPIKSSVYFELKDKVWNSNKQP